MPEVYDFTGTVEAMDDETRRVFYLLDRVAILEKDEVEKAKLRPVGRKMTPDEVRAILGGYPDRIDPKLADTVTAGPVPVVPPTEKPCKNC